MQPTVNHSADNTTVTWPTIKIGVNAENIREAPYGLLADVLVPAGATSIIAGNVRDRRDQFLQRGWRVILVAGRTHAGEE